MHSDEEFVEKIRKYQAWWKKKTIFRIVIIVIFAIGAFSFFNFALTLIKHIDEKHQYLGYVILTIAFSSGIIIATTFYLLIDFIKISKGRSDSLLLVKYYDKYRKLYKQYPPPPSTDVKTENDTAAEQEMKDTDAKIDAETGKEK